MKVAPIIIVNPPRAGITRLHGLLVGPPIQGTTTSPAIDHDENCQPTLGMAVTVIISPPASMQPLGLGQFGDTEPDPASTRVIRVSVGAWARAGFKPTKIRVKTRRNKTKT